MHVNFNELSQIVNAEERGLRIDDMIKGCVPGDPLFLSDILLQAMGPGQDVLIGLADAELEALQQRLIPIQWTIKVIRDCWGNPPEPGDRVPRRYTKPIKKRNGKFYRTDELNIMKINGTYDKIFHPVAYYDMDEKGCILCGFQDAVYFLNQWGIHPITKSPVSFQVHRPHSSEPLTSPDGNMYHKWNHLYMEVTKEMHAKLPKIEKAKEPKRGIKKEEF